MPEKVLYEDPQLYSCRVYRREAIIEIFTFKAWTQRGWRNRAGLNDVSGLLVHARFSILLVPISPVFIDKPLDRT